MPEVRPSARLLTILLTLFPLASLLSAQNSSLPCSGNRDSKQAEIGSERNSEAADHQNLRLGAGDLLEIKVFGAPELSDTLRVSSAGEITMPLIGAVKVAGESTEDAQKQIEQRLLSGGFLRDPHVNVLIKEYASQGISVLGEVAHPGIYPLLGSRTLLDAIAAAGGTTNRAGRTVAIAHRRAQNGAETSVILAKEATEAAKQNVELQPGDTVIVSKAGIVYVSGDVKLPGGYLLDNNENLTVLQAIAMAQGLIPPRPAEMRALSAEIPENLRRFQSN